MKLKLVLVLVLSLVLFGTLAGTAAADARPLAVAASYETALNAGDFEGLTALFAPDAVYVTRIGGEEIIGSEAISRLLEEQHRDFRSWEIVAASMAGNDLTLIVDISDHGIAWGRQTLRATVEDGLVIRLEPLAFRFIF